MNERAINAMARGALGVMCLWALLQALMWPPPYLAADRVAHVVTVVILMLYLLALSPGSSREPEPNLRPQAKPKPWVGRIEGP